MIPVLPNRTFVLAGGLGTRLKKVVPDRPKVLAPVMRHTFLDYLLAQLHTQGLRRFVFLLGFKHEMVERHLAQVVSHRLPDLGVAVSVEKKALGTGGALKRAERLCDDTFFLVNGDTYLGFEPREILEVHRKTRALVTLAARPVANPARFGSLEVDADGRVLAFREKVATGRPGLINAGIQVIEPRLLQYIPDDRVVSLEREIFPALLSSNEKVMSMVQEGIFFDIGTAESFKAFKAFASSASGLIANPSGRSNKS